VAVARGDAEFLPADSIVILAMCGSAPMLAVGGKYQVRGAYRLSSRERASLHLSVGSSRRARVGQASPGANTTVTHGSGQFVLELALRHRGYPHLTFYSLPGHPFGGLYFGKDEWLLPNKGWSYFTPRPDERAPDPREGQPFQLL
jgi:hypothetical protein